MCDCALHVLVCVFCIISVHWLNLQTLHGYTNKIIEFEFEFDIDYDDSIVQSTDTDQYQYFTQWAILPSDPAKAQNLEIWDIICPIAPKSYRGLGSSPVETHVKF